MKKLLIICGPTASGKTKLGLRLAKKYNGEIVSADSRQIYCDMDVITGKDLPMNVKCQMSNVKCFDRNLYYCLYGSIPVWGLDIVKPNEQFSVAHWVKFANKVINNIWERGKLPIIVGGSGFWIKTLIKGVDSLGIPPNWKLRNKLGNKTIRQLSNKLKRLDYQKWELMNQSDRNNSRRLIRAIEIALQKQKPKIKNKKHKLNIKKLLIIGLKTKDYQNLYQKIDKRVEKRVKEGAEKEIRDLIKQGYSWDLPSFSAAGYRLWEDYFEKRKNIKETVQHWKYSEHKLARKQMVFFKKMKDINWFDINQLEVVKKIEKKVSQWYDKNIKY